MTAPNHPSPRSEPAPQEPWAGSASAALDRFAASLRHETDSLEASDSDELCRAVDGEFDPSEQALWEERLAADPCLARRTADLARFRAELSAPENEAVATPRVLTFRRPPARVSLSGWLAAAAVLLLAVAVREVPRLVETHGSVSAAVPRLLDWSDEPLFADGFEAGDAAGWSSASPSG